MTHSGIRFGAEFDAGNILDVQQVKKDGKNMEFNVWLKSDCYQTQYQV